MQTDNDNATQSSPFRLVNEVEMNAPLQWLRRGYSDMLSNLSMSLFYGVCFFLGGAFLLWMLRDRPQLIPIITSGFLIVGPFLAMGLYEISREHEKGEDVTLLHTMTAWKSNIGQLAIFGAILLLIYLGWAQASMKAFATYYSGEIPSYKDFMLHVIETDQIDFLLIFFGIGSIFVAFTFAISVVSIPLILDRGYSAIDASLTSAAALATNVNAMIVWASLIALLTLGGLLTLLLGIIVIGPLLGHATWHAYRDLIALEK